METGQTPGAEELAQLEEELAEARAEIERLQQSAAEAHARAEQVRAEADELRRQAAARTEPDAESRAAIEAAEQRLRAVTERYRDAVLRAEPALPPELIRGDDVDAIDASVEAAREIVGRVRAQIDTDARTPRVPAGAPPRSAPDVSALSAEQKIRLGLSQRS